MLLNETELKGPHRKKQTQEQNKKEKASSVGLCQRHTTTTSPPGEGEPVGSLLQVYENIVEVLLVPDIFFTKDLRLKICSAMWLFCFHCWQCLRDLLRRLVWSFLLWSLPVLQQRNRRILWLPTECNWSDTKGRHCCWSRRLECKSRQGCLWKLAKHLWTLLQWRNRWEDLDSWSSPPLTILCWRTLLVITNIPEDGPGIAQMDNTTTRLITF